MVRQFLSAAVDMGVIPPKPSIVLWTPSGKTREYPNPFTDGKVVVELKDHKKLKGLGQLERAASELPDYEVEVSAEGKPTDDLQGNWCGSERQ